MGCWVHNHQDDGWEDGWTFVESHPEVPQEFIVTDDEVTELLGPDGEPLLIFRDREPFGFQVR